MEEHRLPATERPAGAIKSAPTHRPVPNMPLLPRRQWNEMTTEEVASGSASDWVAILPVAAIEQHGPHLPLATDAIIGAGLLHRAMTLAAGLPLTALPMQEIGASDEHRAMAGTLTLRPETLAAVLLEACEGVVRAGIRRLILVSAHGGNGPTLDGVSRALRIKHGILAVATSFARFGVPDEMFSPEELAFGVHGGAIETSLMLHLRPDLVRMEKAAYFGSLQQELADRYRYLRAYGPVQFGWLAQDLNPAGVVGDARAATPQKGRAIADHQAGAFAELCREVCSFDLARLSKPDDDPRRPAEEPRPQLSEQRRRFP